MWVVLIVVLLRVVCVCYACPLRAVRCVALRCVALRCVALRGRCVRAYQHLVVPIISIIYSCDYIVLVMSIHRFTRLQTSGYASLPSLLTSIKSSFLSASCLYMHVLLNSSPFLVCFLSSVSIYIKILNFSCVKLSQCLEVLA